MHLGRQERTPATDAGGSGKLAATVADRIVADVIARDWPVGVVLGSEADLLARYGVSRAVFREAVRLVEHQQVARMRRGPGGGLVVTEPTVDAILDAAVLYLHRVGARLDEVFEARIALEELVVQLAPGRLGDDDVARIRELLRHEAAGAVADHRAMHSLLAAATANPALECFIDILNRVMLLYFADARAVHPQTLHEAVTAHARIAEAVIAGDGHLARRRMRKHLEAEAAFLRRRRASRQVLDPVTAVRGGGGKLAEEVARQIFRAVLAGGLAPGDLIGSEAELMDRHGVSRAVTREAVRLLEHHHIAVMRRGPGGGLFVVPPSVAAVTDVVALYLERHGITGAAVFELRIGVELALVDQVVTRLDAPGRAGLRAALEHEITAADEDFTAAAHDVHAAIAAASGNRVLELLSLVLIRLTRLHEAGPVPSRLRRRIGSEVSQAHGGIVEALVRRDRALARRRMQRHLDTLAGFYP